MKRFTKLILALTFVFQLSFNSQADAIFSKKIKPWLNKYCADCHGAVKPKDKVRVDNLTGSIKSADEIELWTRILESLEFGEMPSDKAKIFPTKPQLQYVQKWIRQTLSKNKVAVKSKSFNHGYGNLVSHDSLFSPANKSRSVDVAARLWRISPTVLEQYLMKVSTNKRGNTKALVNNPFKRDHPHGKFSDFKGMYPIDSLVASQLAELALAAVKPTADKSKGNYNQAIKNTYRNILRREPSNAEVDSLLTLAKKIDSEHGAPGGLQAALAAIILKPETIFRQEGSGDSKGELVMLSRYELANAFSFALTDKLPTKAIENAFNQKNKPVKEIIKEQARKLFSTYSAKTPNIKMLDKKGRINKRANMPDVQRQVLRFFQEYFDYAKAKDVFKDKIKGYYNGPHFIVDSLDQLVVDAIQKDKQVFKTLLTTSTYYLHPYSFEKKGIIIPDYGLAKEVNRSKPYTFPKNKRMGVLTHPAWLLAHSVNLDNDPIHRGKWVKEKLLGGSVPDVPINVDAKLPDEPTWTLRKRLSITEADSCYKCHSKMNPLGLPFEQFDHYGRYRTKELGKPVNTASKIINSGETKLDGVIKNPFEMISTLAESERVEQVFVRHVFRFFMGRNETLGDSKTLQDAHKAYVESNGSMKALVTSILCSDSFIYRKK